MKQVASVVAKRHFAMRMKRIDAYRNHPLQAQQQLFKNLLTRGAQTVWGQQHQIQASWSYEQFAKCIPLQDYNSLLPFIERSREGERDVLWPGVTRWFAKSSGTSGAPSKFIPVTDEGLEQLHIRTGKDFLSCFLHQVPSSRFFMGKGLVMGGSCYPENRAFTGDVSAILMKNLPGWIQHYRTPGLEVALIPQWQEKLDAIARTTSRQNITNISGVPSWTLLLLQRVLDLTGAKDIGTLWPELEFYAHGGVSMLPYRSSFEALVGRKMNYFNVYNASEGFFAFQDVIDADDMLLACDNGVFYEFISLGSGSHGDVVPLEAVTTQVPYAMVITTNCGLWRYQLGDTIQFTSLFPHRIQITGRTQHFINAFGEEVTVANADSAIAAAAHQTGAMVREYTAAPCFISGHRGCHEWAIEFLQPPANLDLFTHALDLELQLRNSDYAAKRSGDLLMTMPIVHEVAPGRFYAWLQQERQLGVQQKLMRLHQSRQFLEAILR